MYLQVWGGIMKRKRSLSFRFLLALYISKIIQILIKLIFKNKGTQIPGRIAIKICPDFLSRIGRPNKIIAVTGTNGKTSTSNFINDILVSNKITTINNSKGSNMPAGIASCFIEKANLKGLVKEEVAILEVDERVSGFIYDHIEPNYLICTNLFRDSIKRNGHTEFILTKIKSSIPKKTILILNADDLISSNIGNKENKKIFFAVNKIEDKPWFKNIVCDIMTCPKCKNLLSFKYRHYHHIGSLYCTKCGFKSPDPDFIVKEIDFKNKEFIVEEKKDIYKYPLISDSIFNIYNMLAAIVTLRTYGLSSVQIKKGMKKISIKKDRYNKERIKNIEINTLLSKDQNPISCSRMFDYVSSLPGNKVIVLLITDSKDKIHGSEDISWIYDTDFEYLNTRDIKQIIVAGTRCYDVLLRLELAGVKRNKIKISSNYDNLNNIIDLNDIDKVFVLYELYAYPLAKKLKSNIIKKVVNNND